MRVNGVYVVLATLVVLIVLILPRLELHPRHEQCVVCHPSGKLAMWGECE